MAKLSDVNNQNPMDSLESLKRRYQRQNRELAKANANQAQQIQALQAELTQSNAENLRLNGEIIHLKKELDTKDSRKSLNVGDGTKRLLEEKLFELNELVKGLNTGGNGGRRRLSEKYFPKAVKPERERPEPFLQEIPELEATGQTPASPLFGASKKNEARFDSPSKGYIPLDSAMFDIRPRRRRDSSTVDSLVIENKSSNAHTSQVEEENTLVPKESNKRKYPDTVESVPALDDIEDRIVPPRLSDIEEVFSSPFPEIEERTSKLPEGLKEFKDSDADVPSKSEVQKNSSPIKLDVASASRFVSTHRRSLENVRELNQLQPVSLPPPAETRRVLEPKSTNIVNINNSPVKLPTAADFEYVKKEKPTPRDRDPVKKASKFVAKPIIVQGSENTMTPEKNVERNRRTRGVTVNYALPALNKKMRRETETLVDAVTGIQPKKRSVNDDTSRDNTPAATPATRNTESDRKSLKLDLEDLERRTSKMTIHHDAQVDSEPTQRKRSSIGSERLAPGVSERELRRMMADRATRERDPRLEEARKDIFEFTQTSSPEQPEINRRASGDRTTLIGSGVTSSHSRRTSGGASLIATSTRKEGDAKTAPSANLKSATELLEERRKRRATLAGTTSGLTAEGKPRKTVGFADTVEERQSSGAKDSRRRSMVI
ncbi:hypothetical protein ABW19_dt0202913 [Dactylella cylindrospora]|nr:hypothetical protein ABW19_dt0202913 [Dactylella cylindrospora]